MILPVSCIDAIKHTGNPWSGSVFAQPAGRWLILEDWKLTDYHSAGSQLRS